MQNLNPQVPAAEHGQSAHALIFPIIRDIMSKVLVLEPDEITQDTSFDEEDLDILDTPYHDRIITQIQKHYADLQIDLHLLRDCMTVAELVSMIEEEQEFADM